MMSQWHCSDLEIAISKLMPGAELRWVKAMMWFHLKRGYKIVFRDPDKSRVYRAPGTQPMNRQGDWYVSQRCSVDVGCFFLFVCFWLKVESISRKKARDFPTMPREQRAKGLVLKHRIWGHSCLGLLLTVEDCGTLLKLFLPPWKVSSLFPWKRAITVPIPYFLMLMKCLFILLCPAYGVFYTLPYPQNPEPFNTSYIYVKWVYDCMNRVALWVKWSFFKVSSEVPVTYWCPINGGLTSLHPNLSLVLFGKGHRFLTTGGEDVCLHCLMVTMSSPIKNEDTDPTFLVSSREIHFPISFEFHSLTAWASFYYSHMLSVLPSTFFLTLYPVKNLLPSLWPSKSKPSGRVHLNHCLLWEVVLATSYLHQLLRTVSIFLPALILHKKIYTRAFLGKAAQAMRNEVWSTWNGDISTDQNVLNSCATPSSMQCAETKRMY